MTPTEKIQKLNTLAENIRVATAGIVSLFDDNKNIEQLVWKINKQISALHQEVCKTLEKEITIQEFNNIVKNLNQYEEDL